MTNEELDFEPLVADLTEHGYALFEQFLSDEETAALRAVLRTRQAAGQFRAAGIGAGTQHQVASDVRGDSIHWFDDDTAEPAERAFLDRIAALSQYLNRRCFLGIRSHEIHYAAYPPGTFYRRHLDVFQTKRGRVLSVICYLNDAWVPADGGQLRLFLPDESGNEQLLDVDPLGGRLVCFESDRLEHEVLSAHRERLSLTGWLRNQ
jgi:SM-20-related protein